ncbi:sialic acid-binding Ig-like lectin 5 [Alosa alosa]|uniref:sialic acid-binding Ig-like lectin 5 n=1 Tax=Alosa alosa TaxID=278164 RepID=UPI002015194A|nr:sialic acid-binding Ig-like lectin 5 [Alosa alosa]
MLLIFIHILHFQGYVVWSAKNGWKAQIPSSVVALENSCVVVPCTYEHPNTNTQTKTLRKPFWYISDTQAKMTKIGKMVYSVTTTKIEERFQSRTSMPGNINEKNCSLQIDNLKKDDVGPYIFRIEIPQFDNYSFTKYPANINVKVKKDVRSGENVTLSCSASHSCPPHPPTITWSRDGRVTVQSEPLTGGQHKLTSSLSFNANASDHQQPITCSVQHHGGKKYRSNPITITTGDSATPDDKENVVHTTHAPVTEDIDGGSTHVTEDPEDVTTQLSVPASHGPGLVVTVVVPLLIIAIAMLVGFIVYRKYKRKQNTQPNLYVDKQLGNWPCLEMSDEVYANTEVITAGKDVDDDVGDEDIYANAEFLQSKNPAIWMNHGLGSAKEPDEDIYANM